MAEKTLRLVFENALDTKKNVTISVSQSDDTKSASDIRSAMNIVYANREIFNLDIGEPKSAAFITPQSLAQIDINA